MKSSHQTSLELKIMFRIAKMTPNNAVFVDLSATINIQPLIHNENTIRKGQQPPKLPLTELTPAGLFSKGRRKHGVHV